MATIDDVFAGLAEGAVIPYLGPGVLAAMHGSEALPGSPARLVLRLTAKASVPHKVRNNLTAAAQFIENFKHRKTVVAAMTEAFTAEVEPGVLHRYFASLPQLPVIVSTWYDDLLMKAFASRDGWGAVQGVSQSEHFGTWVHYFDKNGTLVEETRARDWPTLLYQPLGSIAPAANFLVSDTDFVEVLTEIDIQTPIPALVQELRRDRHFLFLGCRFANQLDRLFARQIMKRSSDKHWALIEGELTRNEARFLAELNIERIDMSLAEFLAYAGQGGMLPLAAAV
jgi:hypothetical protein